MFREVWYLVALADQNRATRRGKAPHFIDDAGHQLARNIDLGLRIEAPKRKAEAGPGSVIGEAHGFQHM